MGEREEREKFGAQVGGCCCCWKKKTFRNEENAVLLGASRSDSSKERD